MDRATYDEYLRRFEVRDYDGLLEYYADEFEVLFAGYALRSRDEVKAFYSFFHDRVCETLTIDRYLSDDSMIALEGRIRLEATKGVTREELAERGFDRLVALPAGLVVEIPQCIHYHIDADGKFTKAICAVIELPKD